MLILRLERNGRAYERGVQAACRSPSRADRSTRSAAIIVIKRDGWYYRVERSTPHPSTSITGPVTVVPPDRARRSTGHRAEARVTGSHAPRPNLSVGHRCAAPFHEFPAKESTLTAIVATVRARLAAFGKFDRIGRILDTHGEEIVEMQLLVASLRSRRLMPELLVTFESVTPSRAIYFVKIYI